MSYNVILQEARDRDREKERERERTIEREKAPRDRVFLGWTPGAAPDDEDKKCDVSGAARR